MMPVKPNFLYERAEVLSKAQKSLPIQFLICLPSTDFIFLLEVLDSRPLKAMTQAGPWHPSIPNPFPLWSVSAHTPVFAG